MAISDHEENRQCAPEAQDGVSAQQDRTEDEAVAEKVKAVIEEIRPYLQSDGGDCEFVSYEDGIVYVRLQGACCGCPGSLMTLRYGIENRVRELIPQVEAVEMA